MLSHLKSAGLWLLTTHLRLSIAVGILGMAASGYSDGSENPPEEARIVRQQLKTEAELNDLATRVLNAQIVTSESCWDLPWREKTDTLPGATSFDCGEGGYFRSIHFSHPHGQNGSFQERVSVRCCRLNIGIKFK